MQSSARGCQRRIPFATPGWADYPWWFVDTWSRVSHAAVMTQQLLDWVKTAHPYWNRTGGADHVWLFAHDEGACWAPREVYERSLILTHWGRLEGDHESGTSYGQVRRTTAAEKLPACLWECLDSPSPAPFQPRQHPINPDPPFPQDNYTADVTDDPFLPKGYTHLIKGHPCYTPGKDLVIPLFRGPDRWAGEGETHSRNLDDGGKGVCNERLWRSFLPGCKAACCRSAIDHAPDTTRAHCKLKHSITVQHAPLRRPPPQLPCQPLPGPPPAHPRHPALPPRPHGTQRPPLLQPRRAAAGEEAPPGGTCPELQCALGCLPSVVPSVPARGPTSTAESIVKCKSI